MKNKVIYATCFFATVALVTAIWYSVTAFAKEQPPVEYIEFPPVVIYGKATI